MIYHWFHWFSPCRPKSSQGLCASGDAGGDAWARHRSILMGHDGPTGCQRRGIFKFYLRRWFLVYFDIFWWFPPISPTSPTCSKWTTALVLHSSPLWAVALLAPVWIEVVQLLAPLTTSPKYWTEDFSMRNIIGSVNHNSVRLQLTKSRLNQSVYPCIYRWGLTKDVVRYCRNHVVTRSFPTPLQWTDRRRLA